MATEILKFVILLAMFLLCYKLGTWAYKKEAND